MLHENIKTIRKSKGLSQEELAEKLHIVRQTVSKWEQGLSVPDAELLIALSTALDTPVADLLGENIEKEREDELKILGAKLEAINAGLAAQKTRRRRAWHIAFIVLCTGICLVGAGLAFINSPYLGWDFADPETAVAGTVLHAFEWMFWRIAPFALIGSVVGIVLTRK